MDRDMRDSRNDERGMERPQPRRNEEEYSLDELVEILKIILTEESKKVPMKQYMRIVDVDKAMYFLSSIEKQMPNAIRESRRIVEDRDNILKTAERKAKDTVNDAENRARIAMDDAEKSAQAIIAEAEAHAAQIVDEAQKQARVMVDQSEVSRRAEEEATKLISSARSKAADAARQATQYADTMLSNLEDFLNTELGDVQKSRENLTSKRGN